MSYSDNAYDITNFFVVLKSSWPILYSTKFHCCQTTNGRVKLGDFLLHIHHKGIPVPIQNRVKVSTLYHFHLHENELATFFYLGTSFEGIFCQRKTANLVGVS